MGVVGTNLHIIGSGSASGEIDLPLNLMSFSSDADNEQVELQWDYNDTQDLTGVQINYKTESYPISPRDGTSVVISDTTTKSKIINGLVNDTEYFFRAYPYREVNGVKYYQTYNGNCKTNAIPYVFYEGAITIDDSDFYLIPKATWAEMGVGTSDEIHPMFKVGGKVLDYIAIGRFEASLDGTKAVSKKYVMPQTEVTFDESINYCKNSGKGWHLITRLEWAGITNLYLKNQVKNGERFYIHGNNDYGKDVYEDEYMYGEASSGAIQTGGSFNNWAHNNDLDTGIVDLNGNVAEWNAGFRLYNGELQVISLDGTFNNDAADSSVDQSESSPYWWAIDGTTGELIKPDGSGSTTNSLKISKSGWTMDTDTKNLLIDEAATTYHTRYSELACESELICEKAKNMLVALGMLPPSEVPYDFGVLNDDDIIELRLTAGETLGYAGGAFNRYDDAGIYAFETVNDNYYYYSKHPSSSGYLNDIRVVKENFIGFRASYSPL